MNPWDQFTGVNAGYVFDLYERFQRDPQSVDEATRAAFARWSPEIEAAPAPEPASVRTTDLTAAIATFNLAESIRRFGHLAARLDPLGFTDPIGDPSLLPQSHGLTTDTLARLPASIVAGPVAAGAADALDAIERLRGVYCGTAGHDYNHVFVPDERVWLRQAVETRQFRPPADPINGRELLDRITQVEVFERFLHRTFPGKTRFSLEGLDMMIPILDEIIHDAASAGVQHVMIAMAHRGRLNVLAHILQKPYSQILAEFKDPMFTRSFRIDLGWMGDVKYHAGARYAASDSRPQSLVITMPPNPSHLEAVDPVLARHGARRGVGGGRAWQAAPRHRPRARDSDSRRCGVPRPGRRRRNAQSLAARRISGRRDDSHHRQQPARIHRRRRKNLTARAMPAVSRADSRFRSCTSTPTIRWRASRRRGCRGRIVTSSGSIS